MAVPSLSVTDKVPFCSPEPGPLAVPRVLQHSAVPGPAVSACLGTLAAIARRARA